MSEKTTEMELSVSPNTISGLFAKRKELVTELGITEKKIVGQLADLLGKILAKFEGFPTDEKAISLPLDGMKYEVFKRKKEGVVVILIYDDINVWKGQRGELSFSLGSINGGTEEKRDSHVYLMVKKEDKGEFNLIDTEGRVDFKVGDDFSMEEVGLVRIEKGGPDLFFNKMEEIIGGVLAADFSLSSRSGVK